MIIKGSTPVVNNVDQPRQTSSIVYQSTSNVDDIALTPECPPCQPTIIKIDKNHSIV